MADLKAGDKVKVGKSVGAKLSGKNGTVIKRPYKEAGTTGVYLVRGENGVEESHHGSRLTPSK